MNKTLLIVIGAVATVAVIIGLGISVAVIYGQRNNYLSDSTECPTFPNITSFTAKKKFNQWHWTYKFEDFNGKIQMACPAANRDANVFIGGKLIVKSDIKTLSLVDKNNIRDCHGNIIYVSRTSGIGETLINSNGIFVSFELRDANEENVVAYIEGEHIFNDEFDVKDTNGEVVAHLKRNIFAAPWYWEFTIYKQNTPGSDMRVLSTIAGTKSFAKENDDDDGDICNQYFWGVGITVLVVVCLIFVVGVGLLVFFIYSKF